MCGIFGVINKKTDAKLADKCVDRMAHRGPDGRGVWQDKGTTLGHRRLAILDLSADGAQPMLYGEYATFNPGKRSADPEEERRSALDISVNCDYHCMRVKRRSPR